MVHEHSGLRSYRDGLILTARQRELLEGMLLGDAHLERQGGQAVARLKVEHAQSQSVYVEWKYRELRDWVLSPPRSRLRTSRPGSESTNVGFSTLSHRELEGVRQRFYRQRRKVVPSDVALTPLCLAVWFMDDGSRKSRECRGLYLNTQSFTLAEVQTLQAAMVRSFGMRTSLRLQSDGWQIYVPSDVVEEFIRIVRPHVLESMCYKLPG